MKLFVWHDVLSDYTSGVAFALAETKKQAKELILESYRSPWFARELDAEEPEVYDEPYGDAVAGGG